MILAQEDRGCGKMVENKNGVRLGEDVADDLIQDINQNLSDIGKVIIDVFSKFIKEKIQGINLDELFSKKNEEDLLALWSNQLVKEGLIPQEYAGLPEKYLIHNMQQTAYLDGIYTGYILTMMSLVDNEAPEKLIFSVRNGILPNLAQHYNNREEVYKRYKSEKYGWINQASKKDAPEK